MEERTLNRKDLRRCWRAWMMHNLSSMSFERLESFGFCLNMLPVAKKLYPDAAQRTEQLDGFKHVVEIVRRLTHAHEHHLTHRTAPTCQNHLGDDFGAAQLAQQARASGHAEGAANRAAHLGRHTDALARQ